MSVTRISKSGSGSSLTQSSTIPLTTVFTPNADCTAPSAYVATPWANNQIALQLDSGFSKSTCYPSSYGQIQYDSGLWYSPGVCPYSYEYVATSVQRGAGGDATTLAICCPPGMHTAPSTGWSCYQASSDGFLGFSTGGTTAFGNPISVAWKEEDLSLFTPASAPILALSKVGITFPGHSTAGHTSTLTSSVSRLGSTTTSVNSQTHSGSDSGAGSGSGSSSLSAGAAAGIGVGATLGGLAIIGCLWWLARRYKVTRRSHPLESQEPISGTAHEKDTKGPHLVDGALSEAPNTGLPYEADSGNTRTELEADSRNARAELEAGWQAPEAPSTTRSPNPMDT